jgi:hypothetical protein
MTAEKNQQKASSSYVLLSKKKEFIIFQYENYTIRFKAPYSLEGFTAVKKWDAGYLVVMAKYTHNQESEEEYIDLIPILENLYISPQDFLKPIKEVKIENAYA